MIINNCLTILAGCKGQRIDTIAHAGVGSCLVRGTIVSVTYHLREQEFVSINTMGSRREEKIPISGPPGLAIDFELVDCEVHTSKNHRLEEPIMQLFEDCFAIDLTLESWTDNSVNDTQFNEVVCFHTPYPLLYRRRREAAAKYMEMKMRENE